MTASVAVLAPEVVTKSIRISVSGWGSEADKERVKKHLQTAVERYGLVEIDWGSPSTSNGRLMIESAGVDPTDMKGCAAAVRNAVGFNSTIKFCYVV